MTMSARPSRIGARSAEQLGGPIAVVAVEEHDDVRVVDVPSPVRQARP